MKIFKISNRLFGAIALMAMTIGCDRLLDVEPQSQISEEQFWKTETDAAAGVAAIYDAMQSAYSSKYFFWGEMRSDNFQASPQANATALELLQNTLSEQNSAVTDWGGLYRMIFRANQAINNIPGISGDVEGLLGQAHALRAFAYFDAVRVWGRVPLYLESIKGLSDDIHRRQTSGSYVMDSVIIPDMLKAERLILNRKDRFQFSLSSVYCLQAEVYMHLKEYALAKEALDKLVNLGEFSLVNDPDSYHALFRNEPPEVGLSSNQEETGPELIFSIYYNFEEDGGASSVYNFFWPGVPSYYLSSRLEEKWQETFPTDSLAWHAKYPDFKPSTIDEDDGSTIYGDYFRYVQLYENGKEIGNRRYAKYNTTNFASNIDDTDIVVYRYAGMLLLKAEAELQLGNLQEAVDLVNRIRSARDLPGISLLDFQTKDALLNTILDERQFELLGEGKRWWDLIRNEKAVEVMGPINGQTSSKLLFPIYFEHLVDNPSLIQTPGYN